MAIDPLSGSAPVIPAASNGKAGSAPSSGFGDALQDMLKSVDSSTGEANQAVGRMLDGTGDVH